MKPKLYLPREAVRPFLRKLLRPWTYAALLLDGKVSREGLMGDERRKRGETYVMRAAVMVWKKSATETRAESRNETILEQRARRPRMREQAAKKREMKTKANMKRVS